MLKDIYEEDDHTLPEDGFEIVTLDNVLAALRHMLALYVRYSNSDDDDKKCFVKSAGIVRLSHPDIGIIDVVRDPVRYSYQVTIRRLGQALFRKLDEHGSDPLGGMEAVVMELAQEDPKHEGMIIEILDKNWDGVGDENRRWMA